jgi:ribosomal protein L11 methyltransferase
MAQNYISFTVELPEADSELMQLHLHEAGALGLEVRDSENPPLPGVQKPKPGEALIVAYFDPSEEAKALQESLTTSWPQARVAQSAIEYQDWSESWKDSIRSVETERLWVGPPWLVDRASEGRLKIVIEPKMAFGTGDHPTTFLCLSAIDRYYRQRPAATMLDVGTGTGLLAIAARKLGAARAVGIDNDPHSVVLAQENAQQNGVPEVALSEDSLDRIEGRFDLVVANILANTLIELAPAISAKVSDRLLLAGVLVPQREAVEAACLAQGLTPEGVQIEGEWIRLDLARSR